MSKHAKRRANKKAKQEAAAQHEQVQEPQNDIQRLAAAMAGRNPFEIKEPPREERKNSAKRSNGGSRKNSARGEAGEERKYSAKGGRN